MIRSNEKLKFFLVKAPESTNCFMENILGAHVSPEKSLSSQVSLLSKEGIRCAQIYFGNSRSWKSRSFSPREQEDLKKALKKNSFSMYIHANLPVHLCYPSESYSGQSSMNFFEEVFSATDYVLPIVTHIGKGPSSSLEHLSDNLSKLSLKAESKRPLLCLENAAGQKNEKGVSIDEMRKIFESIDKTSCLGICLDTQHLYAGSVCEFEGEDWRNIYEQYRDIAQVPVVHLNDSLKDFSSGVDRHEDIGQGFIWYKNRESLLDCLSVAEDDQINVILETPHPSIKGVLSMMSSEKEYQKVLRQAQEFGEKHFCC